MAVLKNGLKVWQRLLVISLSFLLPIIVLVWSVTSGINYDIRFSTLEVYGDMYQRPLEKLLELVPEHGRMAVLKARNLEAEDPSGLARRIDAAMADLAAVNAEVGEDLQFTDQGLAMRDRSHLAYEKFLDRWKALRNSTGKPAGDIAAAHAEFVADVMNMIAHSGDTSNLILDPDLDSYYLMDLTLLALPQTQRRIAEVIAFGQDLLDGREITPDERVAMAVHASMLEEADQARIEGSTATSLNEDANFYGPSPSLQKNVPPALGAYVAANKAFVDMVRAMSRPEPVPFGADEFVAAGQRAKRASFHYWNVAADELDLLLGVRIDDYRYKRIYALSASGAALLISALLVLYISRSITRPIASMEDYTRRVAEGDYNAALSEGYSGEFKRLSENVRSMVAELKSRLGFTQGILAGISMPCVVADVDGNISYINKRLLDFLKIAGDPGSFEGRPLSAFFERNPEIARVVARGLESEKPLEIPELRGERGNGDPFFIKIDATPIYDLEGKLLGSFAEFTDLTEVKRQADQLSERNEMIGRAASEAEEISSRVAEAVEGLESEVATAASGAGRQRERTTETATAMEQMNSAVMEVARSAGNTLNQAEETRAKAEEGTIVVDEAVQAIQAVAGQSEELKENMSRLGKQAEAIGQIINVISDIADQTNLLALNAAIEAARAGEHGRGFAVVADEVRKLAEKTMSATTEVDTAIRSIQDVARDNVESMDKAVEAADRAAGLAVESGRALNEIVTMVEATTDQVRSIAAASEEQSSASEEIRRAVDEINDISTETSQGMGNASQSVGDLAEMAHKLRDLIAGMKS